MIVEVKPQLSTEDISKGMETIPSPIPKGKGKEI